jgi:hypothetical protein
MGAVEVRVRRLSTLNESTTEQQEDTCCFQKFGANPKGQGRRRRLLLRRLIRLRRRLMS